MSHLWAGIGGDTSKIKNARPPRHYFNSMIFTDAYATGLRTLDNAAKPMFNKLHNYQVKQLMLGFNVPVATKDFYNKDSSRVSNLHLMLTGSYLSMTPNFGGISDHRLTKTSVGFRGIFNDGKKSMFFVEFSPFVTRDAGYRYTHTYRLASSIIYNFTVNQYFSFRLGYTRSFIWGNAYHLPYIGFRVGQLDRINFSVQFPRSISLNIPIGHYIRTSLYTKPQGGLYSFANVDSLSPDFKNKTIYFGRYEFLSGLRVDVLPSKYFNFYLSSGLTTQNFVGMFPNGRKFKPGSNLSTVERISGSLFINFGIVVRFGKTRSIYNNQQMYNALDLNNSLDPGNNNVNPGNGNIPRPQKKIRHLDPKDVQDLMETEDLY
ncbi:MAG: hypothetical protein JST26_16865 [Bacteroidetes bacterium]|nr:hypothetical protein [Bacteroidota bacterium]